MWSCHLNLALLKAWVIHGIRWLSVGCTCTSSAHCQSLSCPLTRACSSTSLGSWSGATRRRNAAGAITLLCQPRSGRTRRTQPFEAAQLQRLFPPNPSKEKRHVWLIDVYILYLLFHFLGYFFLSYFTFFTWTKTQTDSSFLGPEMVRWTCIASSYPYTHLRPCTKGNTYS